MLRSKRYKMLFCLMISGLLVLFYSFSLKAQEGRLNVIEDNPRFADLFIQAGPFGVNPNRFITGYKVGFNLAPDLTNFQFRGNYKKELAGNLSRNYSESEFMLTDNPYREYQLMEGGVDYIIEDKTTKEPSSVVSRLFRPFYTPLLEVPAQIRTFWGVRSGILNYKRTITAQTDDDGQLQTSEGTLLGRGANDQYQGRIFTSTQTTAASLGMEYSRAKGLLTQLVGAEKTGNYTRYAVYGDLLYNIESQVDSVNVSGESFDVEGAAHGGFPLQEIGFRLGGKITHGKRISIYFKGETGIMPGYQQPNLFWNVGIGVSYNLRIFGTFKADPSESLKSPLKRRKD